MTRSRAAKINTKRHKPSIVGKGVFLIQDKCVSRSSDSLPH